MVELVTDYVEGALSARDRARFERHIAGCPHCTIYLEQMRITIRTLGRLPEETSHPMRARRAARRIPGVEARAGLSGGIADRGPSAPRGAAASRPEEARQAPGRRDSP